jgi:hypothetical protein
MRSPNMFTIAPHFYPMSCALSFYSCKSIDKSTAWIFFVCISSCLTCLKKPVFSKWDLLWWKVNSQAVLGSSSDQRKKVPFNLSLFLKSEKIPALLYVRKRTWVDAPSSTQSCSKGEDYKCVYFVSVKSLNFFFKAKNTNQWSPLRKNKNWTLGVPTNITTYPKVRFVIK